MPLKLAKTVYQINHIWFIDFSSKKYSYEVKAATRSHRLELEQNQNSETIIIMQSVTKQQLTYFDHLTMKYDNSSHFPSPFSRWKL